MARLVMFLLIASLLGWWVENVLEPWAYLKLLERRARREIESWRT